MSFKSGVSAEQMFIFRIGPEDRRAGPCPGPQPESGAVALVTRFAPLVSEPVKGGLVTGAWFAGWAPPPGDRPASSAWDSDP